VKTKRCPDCREIKPVSEFGRNKSLKDGFSFYCLACNRERSNAWYRQHRKALGKEVRDYSWIPDGFRWCPACEQPVAVEDFVRSGGTASGFGSRCRACDAVSNSESYFFRTYGLTKKQLAQIRAEQHDRCAICGAPAPQHLDHDHETGGIRQILCQRCNHGLGLFRDDPALLHSAAFYVEGHQQRQLLERLHETFVVHPASDSPVNGPPVGSQRRPDRSRGDRATGKNSGSRRRKTAGEADT
jgi:Recombination endonuclease VII